MGLDAGTGTDLSVCFSPVFFCPANIPLIVQQVPSMQISDYFSESYASARQVFLTAAQQAGATIESFRNPATTPEGVSLFTDVARLGPNDADRILLLISATHGVEGFAGSAIQSGLLRTSLANWSSQKTGIIMIHALNPFGFASLRRCNEDNIDLNRNFIDHDAPYPVNREYLELSTALNPQSLSRTVLLKSQLRIAWFRLRHGSKGLQAAVTRGQYCDPQGLFYGGRAVAWSNRTMQQVATRCLSRARRMIAIDYHTGLGPYGYGEVIVSNALTDPAYQRALAWWGTERVASTVVGDSVSADLSGTINLALTRMLPDTEVTAVSLEFGTLSPMEVFRAVRAENWLHHHGGPDHPAAAGIKHHLLRAFYPEDPLWRKMVWEQGRDITEQGLSAVAG
jgi:hypothetical protein